MKHNNKPLTLEQLLQMDGQPVWVEDLDMQELSAWRLIYWVHVKCLVLISKTQVAYLLEDYGKSWLAYAQNPVDFDDWTAEWKEVVTHNGCTPDYDCVCSKCGASGVSNDDFCSSCGRAMSENARELLERRLMGERN